MTLERRLAALEATQTRARHTEADKQCDALSSFMSRTFTVQPKECVADNLARCCGLPNGSVLKPVIEAGLGVEAFESAARMAYPGDWRARMQETAGLMLGRLSEVHGDGGLMKFAGLFPGVINAALAAAGATETTRQTP